MDRRLLDYLPPVLREAADMQAVNGANEPEIALAWDVVAMVLENVFPALYGAALPGAAAHGDNS